LFIPPFICFLEESAWNVMGAALIKRFGFARCFTHLSLIWPLTDFIFLPLFMPLPVL
jgi:hypothetical protein